MKRIAGVCGSCGASFDAEFNAAGGKVMYPIVLCGCTGAMDGLTLSSGIGAPLPTVMTLIELPAGVDVDE